MYSVMSRGSHRHEEIEQHDARDGRVKDSRELIKEESDPVECGFKHPN